MPAKSKTQKRLMSMVMGVQKGDLNLSDINPESLRDKVSKMAQQMNQKDVEDFANTNSKELPKKVKEQLRVLIRKIILEEV